jgi:LuxR family maltose regulon positive regulatory protein
MLLPTKLMAPRAPGALVDRPRLVERIEENLGRRLTSISAPAGSGKSTLLGQWIRTTRARTAWLSLDAADDDPRRFGAYLIAALGSIVSDRSASELPSSPGRAELIPLLTRAVVLPFAKEKETSALVLDDYHSIQQPEIHEAVAWLIEQLPPNLHLVIASRTAPPFSLARLRVRRDVLEIGATDLRFSRDEATTFYNEVMRLSLSASDVAAIEERTEGWAAALQLSALSLKGGTDARALVRSLSGEHRLIAEYLAEEVLDQQPDDRRRFLLRTSILDRMCAELCEAVTGEPGAQEQLFALEAANLFLIPLDQSGRWFRYHHLFADLLKKKLTAIDEDVALLEQRAAEWLAGDGRFDEAVRHAMAAGPSAWAEEKLEKWGEALIMAGEIGLLGEWTRSFPEDARRRAPYVGVHAAWASVLSARAGEVEAWAREAEAAAGSKMTPKIAQNLTASRAFAAQNLGRLEDAVALSQAALSGPLQPEIRAALQLNAGQTLRRLGRFEQAVEILEAAARGGKETGHLYLAFGALFHRAASLRVLGRLQAALRALDELEEMRAHGKSGTHLSLTGGLVERSYVHWLWGDQDRAMVHARRAVEGLGIADEPGDVAYGYWVLARVLIGCGELDEASVILDEIRLPARVRDQCGMEHAIETARAEILLVRSDPEGARGVLKTTESPDPETRFDRRWVEARIGLGLGEPVEAIAAQELAASNAAGHLMHASAWAALLAAVRRDAASIGEAARLAERTGIQRWRMMFEQTQSPRTVPPAVVEPMIESLTQRELEVLGLIAAGMSNQDAASRLFVSVGTVKTHVHKILAKLAADNRTEAVHKARALGLIR